jgi:hypothetical protein
MGMFFSPRASATIPPPLNPVSNLKLRGTDNLDTPRAYHQIEKFLDRYSKAHPFLDEFKNDELNQCSDTTTICF